MFFNRTSPNQFIVGNYRYIGSTPTLANEGLRSLWLKPDGTKIFYMGSTAGILRSFDLSEPWNIVTTTNAASSSVRLVDTGSVAVAPRSMAFNSSGTVLFVGDINNAPLYKYTLSNPWDVTSINATASQQSIDVNVTGANSIWFGNNDSTLVVHTIGSAPSLKVNNISSSLDLTTLTLNSNNSSVNANNPTVNFIDNGNKLIIGASAGAAASLQIFTVTSPYQYVGATVIGTYSSILGQTLLSYVGPNGLGEVWMSNDGSYLYAISLNTAILKIHMWMIG